MTDSLYGDSGVSVTVSGDPEGAAQTNRHTTKLFNFCTVY